MRILRFSMSTSMAASMAARAIACLLLAMAMPAWARTADPAPARELRVLFVGNSLTYVNNLPRLLHAMAASQPGRSAITTATYVAPGGTVAERWADGHAAAALRDGHWDVLVLQEQWLARRENRTPRTREQLATLIDTSVYQEALALEPRR